MFTTNLLKHRTQQILALADVQIDGYRPWDIQVHHDGFYSRVLTQGSMGLGESYMDGWWDCAEIDQFFVKLYNAGLERRANRKLHAIWLYLKSLILNCQKKSRSVRVAQQHYDLGNEIFEYMLDRRMVYTCSRWEHAANLDEAQEAKLHFVCRKLNLSPGMRVLDIGCGWGSFAKFAAENYGVQVIGITVSQEQLKLARTLCSGLPVELRLEDYRDVHERFDRVVSLGMFEHVGSRNYRTFFQAARRAIRDEGKLFLATIGSNRSVCTTDPWIERYIFPNSHLPSAAQIDTAIEGHFLIEDWQNWGTDYDRTLMAWFHNFENNWKVLKQKYNERFHRMWRFYLLASAGAFRSRHLQVWQILLSPTSAAR
ncbi:MAG: cyclopropane fatty acyl phospholipid synthase [Candidatus Acidiferrales bacterium]